MKKVILSLVIFLNPFGLWASDEPSNDTLVWPTGAALVALQGPGELTKDEIAAATDGDYGCILKAAKIAIDNPAMQSRAFAWLISFLKLPETTENAVYREDAFKELSSCFPKGYYGHTVQWEVMSKWLPDLIHYKVPTGILLRTNLALNNPKEINETVRLLEQLTLKDDKYIGHAYYLIHLCLIQKKEDMTVEDIKRVRECLHLAALVYKKLEAHLKLGEYHAIGQYGFEKNDRFAEQNLDIASRYNHLYYYNWGLLIEQGHLKTDYLTAVICYQYAAEAGCKKSKEKLAAIQERKKDIKPQTTGNTWFFF